MRLLLQAPSIPRSLPHLCQTPGRLSGCSLACVGNFSHRRCSEVLSPPPLKPSSILLSPSAVPKVPQSEVGLLAALAPKVPQSKGGPPAVPAPKISYRKLSLLRLLNQRLVLLLRPRRHQWLPRQVRRRLVRSQPRYRNIRSGQKRLLGILNLRRA